MRLSISNFLSFGEEVHVNIPVGLTLITGEIDSVTGSSNGAGKSGLLEAITFALWGKARGTGEYPGGEHLIRDGCTSMSVSVALGGIEIIRKRSNGNTSLGIVVDGVVQTFPTISTGDGIVGDRIGINYDTFIRTAYFQQGKDKAFSELTSTEARRKVIEILGLEKWGRRQQKPKSEMERLKLVLAVHRDFDSKNKESDVRKQIEDVMLDLGIVDQVILDVRGRLAEFDEQIIHERANIGVLATRVEKANELMAAEDTTRVKIHASTKAINDKRTEQKTLHTDITNKSNDLLERISEASRLEKELGVANVKEAESSLVVFNIKLPALMQARDTQSVAIGIVESELRGLEARKDALSVKDTGVCPILHEDCDRISSDCLAEAIISINAQMIICRSNIIERQRDKDLASGSVDAAVGAITVANNKITAVNQLLQKINTAGASVGHISEMLESLKASAITVEQVIDTAVANHAVLVDELDKITVAKQGMDELLREVREYEGCLEAVGKDRRQLDDKLTQVISDKSVQESTKVLLFKKIDEVRDNKQKLQGLEDEYIMWDLLSQAFGPNGVSSMQIDAMKEEVEVTANNILQFGKQGVTVKIQLKERKKDGEGSKDVFKILVCDKNDKELPLFRFSGGEGYWVDLAVRVALYLVWRGKNDKSPLDLVMIDEGVGKVDAVKRKVLIDVLRYMSTKVSRVLVITHTEVKDMVESFDNVITIYKNKDVSTAITTSVGI